MGFAPFFLIPTPAHAEKELVIASALGGWETTMSPPDEQAETAEKAARPWVRAT